MAKRNQLTAPMVAVAQASRPKAARRNPGKERENLAASPPLAHHYAARLVDRMNLKTLFARSRPIVVISPMDGSRCW